MLCVVVIGGGVVGVVGVLGVLGVLGVVGFDAFVHRVYIHTVMRASLSA